MWKLYFTYNNDLKGELMKLNKYLLTSAICASMLTGIVPAGFAQTTTQTANLNIALQRGYRTGYSDGYMSGYRDVIDNLGRDIKRHDEYNKASRAFNPDYGTIEDYRDGYQQGFESGYTTGFEKRSFESTLPSNIKRRGTAAIPTPNETNLASTQPIAVQTQAPMAVPVVQQTAVNETAPMVPIAAKADIPTPTYQGDPNAIIIIPRDTELMLEVQDDLSTERNREGDKFTAKVVSPAEIAGAVIEGRVGKVIKPGRIKRRSELLLTFDRIIVSENRWSNFSGTLMEVMPVKGDNIKTVDNEGTAIGKSSVKGDLIKIGGATGAGALTGALFAGPVGAAVGAGVGAGFGVGAVVIERGKHVNIGRNQQMRIKTSYETQIR